MTQLDISGGVWASLSVKFAVRTGQDLDVGVVGMTLTAMTYSPVGRFRRFTYTLYNGSFNGKSRVVYVRVYEFPSSCCNEYIFSLLCLDDRSCNIRDGALA